MKTKSLACKKGYHKICNGKCDSRGYLNCECNCHINKQIKQGENQMKRYALETNEGRKITWANNKKTAK